jgi:hypothetical protein
MSESGLTWDDVLRADLGADVGADGQDAPVEPAIGDTPAATKSGVSDKDLADAQRLINALLARKNISAELRGDLTEMKQSIVEGGFDAMDSRYIRALAKRLGA